MTIAPHEDASAHPKAALQQRRAVLLLYRQTPRDQAAGQAAALEAALPEGMRVFACAGDGQPTVADTLAQVEALGVEAAIAVSMQPAYSRTTTLPLVRELYRQVAASGCTIDVTVRGVWYDDAGYVNAQARVLHEYASAHGLRPADTYVLYAAPAVTAAQADAGDPYPDHVHRTVELVSRRLGWPVDRSALAYLDRPDGLPPMLSDVLADLRRRGETRVLVCPLDLTAGGQELRWDGGELFPCPALIAQESFVAALRNLVLHGRHPASFGATAAGLMAARRRRRAPAAADEVPISALVMVGLSVPGRLGPGGGPGLVAADAEALRRVKKRQCDVPEVLRAVGQDEAVCEAWLWNTCRRFELYNWLRPGLSERERAGVLAHLRRQLLGADDPDDLAAISVLAGADAWQHLLRTAVGLNSGLPGEREVLEQLRAAHRVARRAGTVGPLTERLLAEVAELAGRLREQTAWGRFTPSYCGAALARLGPSIGLDRPDCRCVVIGGSTTSCAVIEALVEGFGVPRRCVTLFHRGHGHDGHLRMLRRAIGSGRRRRVHSYGETQVIEGIADADVVLIGLDRREPVLDAELVRTCRDFSVRPLDVIDFNLFGSTLGLEDVDGVRVLAADRLEKAAAAFAEELCRSDGFARAAEAADVWIREHLPAAAAVVETNR